MFEALNKLKQKSIDVKSKKIKWSLLIKIKQRRIKAKSFYFEQTEIAWSFK